MNYNDLDFLDLLASNKLTATVYIYSCTVKSAYPLEKRGFELYMNNAAIKFISNKFNLTTKNKF